MFKDKTALVTGSTSGIGLGIARQLAAQRAHLILNGFGEADDIERLKQELAERHRVQVRYDAGDMSRHEAIEAMMGKALVAFGCVDLLVNNAGIQHVESVDEFPVDKWYAILDINLSATFHTTRLALPAMKKKGFGRIVNSASAHALVASPCKSACVTARHGVAGFAGREADPRHRQGKGDQHGPGHPQRDARGPGGQEIRDGRTSGRAEGLVVPGRCGLDHRCHPAHRRRLDGALSALPGSTTPRAATRQNTGNQAVDMTIGDIVDDAMWATLEKMM